MFLKGVYPQHQSKAFNNHHSLSVVVVVVVPGTQTREVVTPWVIVAGVDVAVVTAAIDVGAADDSDDSIGTEVDAIPAPPLIRLVNSGAVVVVPLCSRYRSCSRLPDMTDTGGVPGVAGWVATVEPWLTSGG